jgi:hypothetical protein
MEGSSGRAAPLARGFYLSYGMRERQHQIGDDEQHAC